jgi:hypothetical protein
MRAKPTHPKTPHATRRLYTLYLAAGLLFLAVSAVQGLGEQLVPALVCLIFGALFTSIGVYGRRAGVGVQSINTSLDLIAQGRLREAEALLAQAEAQVKAGPNLRAIHTQRAMIAMRRGDLERALHHVDGAIAAPPGLGNRLYDALQRKNAHAIRAFLRASAGDREGARKDLAEVRAGADAPPQALGRAALAEAILLEAAGDRAALREHLVKERAVLLEGTSPRERAIVRAFQRMLNASATTPYRQIPRRAAEASEGDEPPLADWVARIVPAAAPFVCASLPARDAGVASVPSLAPADASAKRAVQRARSEAAELGRKAFWRGAGKRIGALFGGALLLVALRILSSPSVDIDPSDAPGRADPNLLELFQSVAGSVMVAGLLVFAFMIFRARRQTRVLLGALSGAVTGEPRALGALRELAEKGYSLHAAQAHRALAFADERSGDLDAALAHVDRGLSHLSRAAARLAASDLLLPELCAERAFLLAARGRSAEAAAELEALNPAYPFLSKARFRVQLVDLARRGDLRAAARLVERDALDLPLDPRDELLADAVRVAHSPETCGAGEVGRVKEELRTQADLRRWLELVAPSVVRAVELSAEGEAHEATDGESISAATEQERERRAEDEARAEAEAHAGQAIATMERAGS